MMQVHCIVCNRKYPDINTVSDSTHNSLLNPFPYNSALVKRSFSVLSKIPMTKIKTVNNIIRLEISYQNSNSKTPFPLYSYNF